MAAERNPLNPFVIDEFYFANKSFPPRPVFDRPLPHRIHIYSVSFFGAFFSVLLMYLVLFRTPRDFRPYSRMLLLCALTDIVFLLLDFWCQIRPKVVDGVIIFALDGPSAMFGYNVQCLSITLLMGVYILGCAVLPAQYYYRYHLMRTEYPLTTLQTVGLFCIALGVSMVDAVIASPTFFHSAAIRPDFDYGTLWYPESRIPPLVLGDIRYTPMYFYFLYAIISIKTSYSLAMFFGYKTMKQMDSMGGSEFQNERTASMQRQFNRILIIQTIIPLLTAVSPLSYAVICTFFRVDTGDTLCYLNLVLPLLPLLNSFSTIVFVSPYRRFLLRMVGRTTEESTKVFSTTSGGAI